MPDVSAALCHTDCRAGAPAHQFRHDREGNPGFQHPGASRMTQVAEAALDAGAPLGGLPGLLPAADRTRGIPPVHARNKLVSRGTVAFGREHEMIGKSVGEEVDPPEEDSNSPGSSASD